MYMLRLKHVIRFLLLLLYAKYMQYCFDKKISSLKSSGLRSDCMEKLNLMDIAK